ncbi:MAG: CPBP family intramembrane metalloprotease [Chitinophagaceae bacterium]|nr:CPBP family intramembrane metalloprotease [Chitinophagaceae bacterium]
MYTDDSKGVSNGAGFFILLGLWLGGFFLGALLTVPVWLLMGKGSILDMATRMSDPENVNALRVIQVVTTFCAFFLPAYFTAFILNRKPLKLLGFNKNINSRQALLALLIIFCGALTAGMLGQLNEMIPVSKSLEAVFRKLEDQYAAQVEAITNMKTFGDYLVSLVMIALLPAVFEETFFRGGMQNLLNKSLHSHWMAIIITSIIFSLIHFSYYGFLARVCLGIVLGLLFYYSQNLWLSILAHCFNNAFAVTQMYVLLRQGKSVAEAMNDKLPMWWGLIAIVALYALFIVFKKVSANRLNDLNFEN